MRFRTAGAIIFQDETRRIAAGTERGETVERNHRFSEYALCFVSSMALHIHWFLPALLLFIGRFVFGISLWWAAGAAAIFFFTIAFRTMVIGWASRCRGSRPEDKPNKNPYSAGPYKPTPARESAESQTTAEN